MQQPPRKWFRTLSIRIFIVFIGAGFLINVIVFSGFRSAVDRGEKRDEIAGLVINHYLKLIMNDLGSPPDASKIQDFCRDPGIDLRVDGPTEHWACRDDLPAPSQLKLESFDKKHWGISGGHYQGRFFALYERNGYNYAFFSPAWFSWSIREEVILGTFLLLSFIVLAAYLVLRRFLSPLQALSLGTLRYGAGDLKYRVPVQGAQEFQDLALRFNHMAEKIDDMMELRKQILVDISHELRSPITRIKLSLEMMEDSKFRKYLGDDVKEMETLITAILDSARLSAGALKLSLENRPVLPVLQDLVASYRSRGYTVNFNEQQQDFNALLDLIWFRSILQNILENAWKHGASAKRNPEIFIDAAKRQVRIEDYGEGMNETELKRIAEPFYRIDPSRSRSTGGYGLGLSIARKIMELHDGQLLVESTLGRGTTVMLQFPPK